MKNLIKKFSFFIIILLLNSMIVHSADDTEISINPRLLNDWWDSYWICYPEAPHKDYGIYHFRKTFELARVPESFIIHISADNRYKLFCNGIWISSGPARGDLKNWRFETIDLAPYLKRGSNLIAVVVWNFGTLSPIFQFSVQTGLIVQGDSETESVVNTDKSWKCFQNKAYKGIPLNRDEIPYFCVVGPCDFVNGNDYSWGWEKPEFEDSSWKEPILIGQGAPREVKTRRSVWMLVPRNIPLLEETEERMEKIVRQEGIKISDDFLNGTKPFVVPKNKTVKILIDRGHLTTAYPIITVAGGKDAEIKLTYAEALWTRDRKKGNRNITEGKNIIGYYDIFISDGGKNRIFSPLYWRTFRYLEIEIKTFNNPVAIEDFKTIFTGYPFEEKAFFESDNSTLKEVWDVGWRTARLCANETYFDCPYYEQLQYVGDTRIQALISLYVAGDDRLVRNAIEGFDDSRTSEGITYSRYPSDMPQFIPTYSLDWIGMVHDFWRYRDDSGYIKNFLPGIRSVLKWFEDHLNENHLVGKIPWWPFIDWTETFKNGIPPQNEKGESSIISLRFAATLREAADIEENFGKKQHSEYYRKLADRIIEAVYKICWDNNKGMLADTPEKSSFSQHANIWVILLDIIPESKQKELFEKIISDKSITQCSFYYQFYLHQTLKKIGSGDRYLELLKPWLTMIELGLTTFAETPEPTRSDCHAWSAHPNFYLLSLVCGIEPSAPGFKKVEISPNLGSLKQVKAELPHPNGNISVEYTKTAQGGIKAVISLPEGITGDFIWKGKKMKLMEGKQILTF